MVSLVSFINNLKKDITSLENRDDCKRFFFSSILHLMVSLEIASSSILDEKMSFLKLKSSIPASIGSEIEIKKILKEGLKHNYFVEKKVFQRNKKTYYKISKKYSLMITNWYLDNKSKFN